MELSIQEDGYDPGMFMEYPSEYICHYCKRVLRYPQQISCGHRVCKLCCSSLSEMCPLETCQEQIQPREIVTDHAARREISDLIVYCEFKNNGCSSNTKLKNLKEHIESCVHAEIECVHCACKMKRGHVVEHLNSECLYKPNVCKWCDCTFSNKHICPEFPIPCPNACGAKNIPTSELDSHLRDCDLEPRDCELADMGCQYRGLDMETHFVSTSTQHMQLLVTSFRDLQLKHAKLERKYTELFNMKAVVINALRKELGETLSSQGDKIVQLENKQPKNMESRVEQLEVQYHNHDEILREHNFRLQTLETTDYNSVLVWKICDIGQRIKDATTGKTTYLYSQPFHTSRYGYQMCGRIYLNGDGIGKNTHVSLYFVIMRGEYDSTLSWPFQRNVTLMILDQNTGDCNLEKSFKAENVCTSSYEKPRHDMNIATGCPQFAEKSVLKSPTYVKNDTLFVKITVTDSGMLSRGKYTTLVLDSCLYFCLIINLSFLFFLTRYGRIDGT